MEIIVVGCSGIIGGRFLDILDETPHEWHGTYNSTEPEHPAIELDKTDRERVRKVVKNVDPDAVIDLGAATDVDGCEEAKERAWEVNARGTRNVAEATASVDAQYVYVSTDYVFPGKPTDAPYREDEPVSPVNYYGATKYAGEVAAKTAPRWSVLRTSVVYDAESKNFASWILGELEDGNGVDIVDDQTATPTYAPDIAAACLDAVENEVTGLYHAAGPVSCSRFEFATWLAEQFGYDTDMIGRTTTSSIGFTAARPEDSSLDSSRFVDETDRSFCSPKEAFELMGSNHR